MPRLELLVSDTNMSFTPSFPCSGPLRTIKQVGVFETLCALGEEHNLINGWITDKLPILPQSVTTESRNTASESIQNNYFLGINYFNETFVFLSAINSWVNTLLHICPDCSLCGPQPKVNITNWQFWNPGCMIPLRVSGDHSIHCLENQMISC